MQLHMVLFIASALVGASAAPQSSSMHGQQSLRRAAPHTTTDVSSSRGVTADSREDGVAQLALQANTLAGQARHLQKKYLHLSEAALAQMNASLHKQQDSAEEHAFNNGIILPDINALVKGQSLVESDLALLADHHGESFLEQKPIGIMSGLPNITDGWLAQDYFAEQMQMSTEAKHLREASDLVTAALAAVR